MNNTMKLPVNLPPVEWRDFFRRKYKTAFRSLDISGTGVIKRSDLKRWAESGAAHKQDEDARKKKEMGIMAVLDKYALFGRESQITEDEYAEEWSKVSYTDEEARKQNMLKFRELAPFYFDAVDTNGDGVISPEEFKATFTLFGVETDTWKVVFDAIDTNKNGTISRDEHANALIRYFFQSGPEDPISLFLGKVVDE